MNKKPDNDVKIAQLGQTPKPEDSLGALDINFINTQHKNGNIKKARRLGTLLSAEIFAKNPQSMIGSADEPEGIAAQRRILFVFAIDTGIDLFCPNHLVAAAAKSEFFDSLMQNSPEAYDEILDSPVLSAYILQRRSKGGEQDKVGRAFAAQLHKEDDSLYIELGQTLYTNFIDFIKEKIDMLDFEK